MSLSDTSPSEANCLQTFRFCWCPFSNWTVSVSSLGQRLRGGGGGKTYRVTLGGGKRTAECALQNHFWRPQKSGLVWSVPLSFKGNDRESPKKGGGGKRIVGWGVQKRFWGGVFHRIYGMFSTPLSFPPPLAALWFTPHYTTPAKMCI